MSGVLWSHAEEVRRWDLGVPTVLTVPRHEMMDGFASGNARYRYRVVPDPPLPKPTH